ncbi:MAG: hypothetical protein AB1578_07830, partial [Thermodesulfobacteriota bacterium]
MSPSTPRRAPAGALSSPRPGRRRALAALCLFPAALCFAPGLGCRYGDSGGDVPSVRAPALPPLLDRDPRGYFGQAPVEEGP